MIFCFLTQYDAQLTAILCPTVLVYITMGQHIEAQVRLAIFFQSYWTIGQERHQNLGASVPLRFRRLPTAPMSHIVCFKVWYLEFVAQGSRHLLLPVLFARCMSTCPSTSSPPQRAKGVEVTRSEAGRTSSREAQRGNTVCQ